MLIKECKQENIWPVTIPENIDDIFVHMHELEGNFWCSRGQSKHYSDQLLPPLDRFMIESNLDRKSVVELESKSIILFRSTLKAFSPGEEEAVNDSNKVPILMLMQHNWIPTRFLDWSLSPFVSLYFASNEFNDEQDNLLYEDGEIWAFDYKRYEKFASRQWVNFPETMKEDGKFDDSLASIFTVDDPKHIWFVLQFLYKPFARLHFQRGLFSVVSKFGFDHSIAIQNLLEDTAFFHRYVIKKEFKQRVLERLRRDYGIWYGSIYPDSSGVASALDLENFKKVVVRMSMDEYKKYIQWKKATQC